MTADRHFHLTSETPHLHSLEVRKIEPNCFIMHTNGRCLGFDRQMAEQLFEALNKVLGTDYDVASTETFDRLEFEKQRAKTLMEEHPTTRSRATPELDDL
jgi:uncharacterized Fe-S cluster-containing radical SAM superfamily protein